MQRDLKKFLSKMLVFSPIFLIVVCINYFVDAHHLFNTGSYSKKIAGYLTSGKCIENPYGDERLYKKDFIMANNNHFDIISFGSSRSMQINSKNFNGFSFFNFGVSGASLEDYISITELFLQNNKYPKVIVIGVDPWVFNKNSGQTRWKALAEFYYDGLDSIGVDYTYINKIVNSKLLFDLKRNLEIISLRYFQESCQFLFNNNTSIRNIMSARDIGNYHDSLLNMDTSFNNMLLADGSFIEGKALRYSDPELIRLSCRLTVNAKTVYSLGNFNNIDDSVKDLFVNYIRFLKSKNVKVILFLPPYHPDLYDIIIELEEYKVIKKIEDFLDNFSENNKLLKLGSYNPHRINFDFLDFYDEIHPKREAINRYFSTVEDSVKQYFKKPDL